ncbi:MAG: protein kinase [Thermoanaerobaculales bacterium]|jgi:serine/threonine-protein kinase|nr:protein kinase [Thermoanaerobaculales bacterium]
MIGETLANYRILEKLGEGGMGEVWRAEDTSLGREVAIKVLPEAFTADAERLARFEREARVLATFNHARIAGIYGLEDVDGRKLLVMQMAEGETLAQRIDRGPIATQEALKIALQIADGLEAAHDKGIIHRDLKPANITLDSKGEVTILDFGLAKALEDSDAAGGSNPGLSLSPTLTAGMTTAGVLLGTAAYMSPEQARGEPADRRADVWAFGVVLMEMLTGSRVYAGKTLSDTLAGVLAREPEWDELPADTPRPVRALLERCLEKDATQRLQAIGEARIAMERFLADPTADEPAVAPVDVPPSSAKRVVPWTVAAVMALALAAAVFWPRATAENSTMRLEVKISEDPLFVDLGASVEISPDGRKIVYATDGDDGRTLSVRSLDQLEGTPLVTGSSQNQPYHPFFSPDGQWVGFVTPAELKKVPVTGGTPIALCKVNRSRGASWGPDNTIVFAPNRTSGLFTVAAAGGEPVPLTTLDNENGEAAHMWPQVVPGGRVIFSVLRQGSGVADDGTIESVDLATGERKVLHRGGAYGRWVPSGHLVYVRENTLFAMAFDIDRMEATGSASPVVQGVTANSGNGGSQVSFSKNGTLAYVSGVIGVPEYPVMQMNRQGVTSPLWEAPGTYANPKLSPDGRRLSLTVLRDGNWDVWVYDLEREVATRLTFNEGYDGDQVWSPDGHYLSYSSDRQGTENPYRKRADGSGEPEKLADIPHAFWATSWSPDGKWVLGEVQADTFDIWAVPADGEGEPVEFLATQFFDRFPSISPDGRWVAYMSDESGRPEVYVRPFPAASGKWQVSDGGGSWPAWSRDGSEIVFRSGDGLMAAPVSTGDGTFRAGRPERLAQGGFSGDQVGIAVSGSIFSDFDPMPDGENFVVLLGGDTGGVQSHVTLVTDWFDVLRENLPGN